MEWIAAVKFSKNSRNGKWRKTRNDIERKKARTLGSDREADQTQCHDLQNGKPLVLLKPQLLQVCSGTTEELHLSWLSYLEVPTPSSFSYFTSIGDHDTTTQGQCMPQAPWGTPSLLSPTNLLYMHASPAIEHLEFSYNPLDMLDFKTPKLSPNCDVAPWLTQTFHFPCSPQPADPATAVVIRTPSPTPFIVQLDNLPWFKFQVLFCTFLKEEGSMRPYLK